MAGHGNPLDLADHRRLPHHPLQLHDHQRAQAEPLACIATQMLSVPYYGRWMRGEAQKRIGHLYPPVEVTPALVRERPELKPYEGRQLTVIAWLWARDGRAGEGRGYRFAGEGGCAAGCGCGQCGDEAVARRQLPVPHVWLTGHGWWRPAIVSRAKRGKVSSR